MPKPELIPFHYEMTIAGEVPALTRDMAETIVRNAISISARLLESEVNTSLFVNEVREDDDDFVVELPED